MYRPCQFPPRSVGITDSVKLRRNQTNRALDVSASERLRAYHSSDASFNA